MEIKYVMSFTTGGLFCREAIAITEVYFDLKDWTKVKDYVLSKNLLQARTVNSGKRISREIYARLKLLSENELRIIIDGTRQECCYILWLAACRRYSFIYEFAIEVIREKCLSLNMHLDAYDFDIFFNSKAEWHDELQSITDTTRGKLRQVIFKMLREADILTRNNVINLAMLSPRLIETISWHSRTDLLVFPYRNS